MKNYLITNKKMIIAMLIMLGVILLIGPSFYAVITGVSEVYAAATGVKAEAFTLVFVCLVGALVYSAMKLDLVHMELVAHRKAKEEQEALHTEMIQMMAQPPNT